MPADADLPTSRNFPGRRNMEQSMETVTNVPGLKCYQCARLQKAKPIHLETEPAEFNALDPAHR